MQAQPVERVERAAVGQITHNRMAHFGEVNSNLIFSAGLERNLQGGEGRESAQDPVVSDGVLALAVVRGSHPPALILGPAAGNGPAVVLHLSLHDGVVLALDIMLPEQVLKLHLYRLTLGKDQDSAGEFVQAMDDEKLGSGIARPQVLAQMGVGCSFAFMGRGDRQQSRRLVDHQQVRIIVENSDAAGPGGV